MTTFAGVEALEIPPNAVTERPFNVVRDVDRSATPQGNVVTTTTLAPATVAFDCTWLCATRADLNTLTAFLDARVGRLVPCWIPTYQRDMQVESIGGSGTLHARISADVANLIETVRAWQWWTCARPDSTSRYYTQRSLTSPDGGGVYAIDGEVGGPSDVNSGVRITSAQGGIWSRLMYCRMSRDDYRVELIGRASRVTASFLEAAGDV